jgi:hypothetical protein
MAGGLTYQARAAGARPNAWFSKEAWWLISEIYTAFVRAVCFLVFVNKTTSVVYQSEFLIRDPEVLGSIHGATGYSEKQ